MLLSKTAEYALRAVATLAALDPGERLAAADLAQRSGVPVHYLSKVMRKLVVRRLVAGQKGHGGGFALQRPPRDISFLSVLQAIGEVNTDSCAFGWARCGDDEPCPLHPAHAALKKTYLAWAETSTFADVGAATRAILARSETQAVQPRTAGRSAPRRQRPRGRQ